MAKIVKIKNTKQTSDIWVGQLIDPSEYFTIPTTLLTSWQEDTKVHIDVASGSLIVNDGSQDFTDGVEGWNWVLGNKVSLDTPLSDSGIPLSESSTTPSVSWAALKGFINSSLGVALNYIEELDHYHVWCAYKGRNFYVPKLEKNTSDCIEFESEYKHKSNIPEACDYRLSTCRYGRKMHVRYISFHTATINGYNNDNYLDVDHGDVTYIMVDSDRNITNDPLLCKETWIDWEPLYSYEIAGGSIHIPTTLPEGGNWALHVISAPDYPAQIGGSVEFIANPNLKWKLGGVMEEDESLNPVNVPYLEGYHFTKLRWIIQHPVGSQAEFQIQLRIFR